MKVPCGPVQMYSSGLVEMGLGWLVAPMVGLGGARARYNLGSPTCHCLSGPLCWCVSSFYHVTYQKESNFTGRKTDSEKILWRTPLLHLYIFTDIPVQISMNTNTKSFKLHYFFLLL